MSISLPNNKADVVVVCVGILYIMLRGLIMGKNMKHALAFAIKYPGWHSWDTNCRATHNAICSLAKRGLIEVNKYNQFRRQIYNVNITT